MEELTPILELPVNVWIKILENLSFHDIQQLRLASSTCKAFVDESFHFVEKCKIKIPYIELQKPSGFTTACNLLKKLEPRPSKNFAITFPPNKPGTVLLALLCNLLKALYTNVKISEISRSANVEPNLQISTSRAEVGTGVTISIMMDFNSNDSHNLIHLLPFKIWNSICETDPDVYEVYVKLAQIEMEEHDMPDELEKSVGSVKVQIICVHANKNQVEFRKRYQPLAQGNRIGCRKRIQLAMCILFIVFIFVVGKFILEAVI